MITASLLSLANIISMAQSIRYLLIGLDRKRIGDICAVEVSPQSQLMDLKRKVVETRSSNHVNVDYNDLVLWKLKTISGNTAQHIENMIEDTNFSDFGNNPCLDPLSPFTSVSNLGLQSNEIVLVQLPSPTPRSASCTFSVYEIVLTCIHCIPKDNDSDSGPRKGPSAQLNLPKVLRPYEEMFINVRRGDVFQQSDLQHNNVISSDDPPPFVVRFSNDQDRKPKPQDDLTGWKIQYPILDEYLKEGTTRTDSARRRAKFFEVEHFGWLAHRPWEVLWNGSGQSFDKSSAKSMLFDILSLYSEETIKAAKRYVLTPSHLPDAI